MLDTSHPFNEVATSLLGSCASDRSKFFEAKNAQLLIEAFEEIGRSLSELRVSA